MTNGMRQVTAACIFTLPESIFLEKKSSLFPSFFLSSVFFIFLFFWNVGWFFFEYSPKNINFTKILKILSFFAFFLSVFLILICFQKFYILKNILEFLCYDDYTKELQQ